MNPHIPTEPRLEIGLQLTLRRRSPRKNCRLAEGADHLKIIYDDGSGVMLNIPALDVITIETLVAAAHRHGLVTVAHVSTANGAVTVARAGVDVLAHAPMDRLTDEQVRRLAAAGVAVIATLSINDGFPGPDGVMPLLADEALCGRLTPRWRRVIEQQATRWLPPPPDAQAQRDNVAALHAAGVPILAGTDASNPGLVHGASLHRELQHLVRSDLTPSEALAGATSVPSRIFGLHDRGLLQVGARADLVLLDGDPTREIAGTTAISRVWVHGEEANQTSYPGSDLEDQGIQWLAESVAKIVRGIRETWPDMPVFDDGPDETGEPKLGR